MARLAFSGFESQIFATVAGLSGETPVNTFSTTSVNTTNPRSGLACLATTAGSVGGATYPLTGTLDRAYFLRAYLRFTDATPTTATTCLWFIAGGLVIALARLETDGTLTLRDANNAAVGSASSALSDNTYYRVELKVIVPTAGSGTAELKLDGTTVASSAAVDVNNAFITSARAGSNLGAGSPSVLVDDFALNDDQGANQNSYPGAGAIVQLKPTSDNALGNWTDGAAGSSNIFGAVDNRPPTGVATASSGATNQIENVNTAASNNYDANMTTYTAAGVGASDTINVVQGIVSVGVSSLTGTNLGIARLVSNPDDGADTSIDFEGSTAIAGTETAGWQKYAMVMVHSPSVTLGTAPVMRVQKTTSTSRIAACDLMGINVDYTPGVAAAAHDDIVLPFPTAQRGRR